MSKDARLDLLQRARGLIASERERWICVALAQAGIDTNQRREAETIESEIEDELNGMTVESWLACMMGWRNLLMHGSRGKVRRAAYLARLAWLDKLIMETTNG